jgi:hypothetical protein
MKAEFKTFRGRPIEDKNWFFAIQFILGEKRAMKWMGIKTVSIPLGRDDDG